MFPEEGERAVLIKRRGESHLAICALCELRGRLRFQEEGEISEGEEGEKNKSIFRLVRGRPDLLLSETLIQHTKIAAIERAEAELTFPARSLFN